MSVKIACELAWANDAVEISKKYDNDNTKYCLKVENISEKAKQKLEADYGMKIKNNENEGFFFRVRSKYPFSFVTQSGQAVEAESIGNKTKAIVEITGSYTHKQSKNLGKSAIAKSTVVITELIKYEPKESSDEGAPFESDEAL
jgi:hypothetical protein